jgi:CRISPR-associated protein Csb2
MKTFIDVRFIAGEYGGVEFPPAPTRLLQAVIAATGNRYVTLLRHLETQAPVIYASSDFAVVEFATYVPNNDENLEHANAANQKKIVLRRSDDLRVVYEYNLAPELLPILCETVKEIQALGRTGDWVLATASENVDVSGLDKYEVRELGSIALNMPVSGFVDSVFGKFNNSTALKLTSGRYAKNAGSPKANVFFDLTEPVPLELTSHVVSWIRHAGMKRLPAVSGHGDHDSRLVITPVPTLAFNDNMIRRVIVTAPNAATGRMVTAKLAGLHLTAEGGESKGHLVPADSDAVFSDYLSENKKWVTVTPILGAFDNGDLKQRSRNFARMFRHAGLPVPVSITTIPKHDRFFVSKSHGHDKLPRFHMAVEFEKPVSGIVATGAGRYAGLGVFANLSRFAAV